MQLTAAVINAGLGDLTLGLQMSRFQVIAAFEPEEKSTLIHRHNLDTPLHPLSIEEIDANALHYLKFFIKKDSKVKFFPLLAIVKNLAAVCLILA